VLNVITWFLQAKPGRKPLVSGDIVLEELE